MRNSRFTFLCNRDERNLLTVVARQLARTESDTVRWLIREVGRELIQVQTDTLPPEQMQTLVESKE
jgi:hypothetical protein